MFKEMFPSAGMLDATVLQSCDFTPGRKSSSADHAVEM